MSNGNEFGFVPFGIFGSVIVGIGMIVGGAVSGTFALSIVGVIVMVCGIGITIACVVARAIKSAKFDDGYLAGKVGDTIRNAYRDARTSYVNSDDEEDDDVDEEYDEDEDEIPLDELVAKINEHGNTASDVCDRDDALTDLLYRADREDLADKYYDLVNEIWDCISGDEYSENTAFIDGAIDTFYRIYCDEIDEKTAISRLNAEKTALFAKKFDQPIPDSELEKIDGATAETDEINSKTSCDTTLKNVDNSPTETDGGQTNPVAETLYESEQVSVTSHETNTVNSTVERHDAPKEHKSAGRGGAVKINYKPIKKK